MFTSYFGNIKNLPEDLILVSISRSCPNIKDRKIYEFKELAPSYDLLNRYKNGKCTKVQYIKEYTSQLFKYKRTPEVWLSRIIDSLFKDGIETVEIAKLCFLCYEKYKDEDDEIVFCHRHIFSSYMNSTGNYNITEYGRLTCRLIVAGTRYANNRNNKDICFRCVKYAILKVLRKYGELSWQDIEIVQGGAKGADMYGKMFARKYGFEMTQMDADWDRYGKSAGYIRNKEMAEYSVKADISVLVAFPAADADSKGTDNMIILAHEYKFNHIIRLYIETEEQPFY